MIHEAAREGLQTATDRLPLHRVRAARVILAAGALSTTFLLLRNRAGLPGLSPALGTGFSGNGDLLTFALRCRVPTEGGSVPRELDPFHGPTITSAIRGEDFYLEEAGIPVIAAWMLGLLEAPRAMRRARPLLRAVRGRHRDPAVSADVSALFGDGTCSTSMLPLLGMGRDRPGRRRAAGRRRAGRRLAQGRRLRAVLRPPARGRPRRRPRPGRPLRRQPDLVAEPPDHGAPARGRADGRDAGAGRGRPVRRGVRSPGPARARRRRDARPGRAHPALTIAAFADRGAEALLEAREAPAASPARLP